MTLPDRYGGVDLAGLLRDPDGYDTFTVFGDQDSMCVSYGVRTAAGAWFAKTAAGPATAALLRRAAAFHAAVRHPAIVAPLARLDLGDRAALLYPWHPGRVLYHPTRSRHEPRDRPGSPMREFRAQPLPAVARAVDDILDAHLAVSAAGFVAVDFYDGAMLYDPTTATMRLVDLDEYRPGPFTVDADRLPGSARFMSPEEFTRGATIDDRTTVFVLGRTARTLMDAGDREDAFRGTPGQLAAIARATRPDPADRYPDVATFVAAFRAA